MKGSMHPIYYDTQHDLNWRLICMTQLLRVSVCSYYPWKLSVYTMTAIKKLFNNHVFQIKYSNNQHFKLFTKILMFQKKKSYKRMCHYYWRTYSKMASSATPSGTCIDALRGCFIPSGACMLAYVAIFIFL